MAPARFTARFSERPWCHRRAMHSSDGTFGPGTEHGRSLSNTSVSEVGIGSRSFLRVDSDWMDKREVPAFFHCGPCGPIQRASYGDLLPDHGGPAKNDHPPSVPLQRRGHLDLPSRSSAPPLPSLAVLAADRRPRRVGIVSRRAERPSRRHWRLFPGSFVRARGSAGTRCYFSSGNQASTASWAAFGVPRWAEATITNRFSGLAGAWLNSAFAPV
jgi:hypothetical protein